MSLKYNKKVLVKKFKKKFFLNQFKRIPLHKSFRVHLVTTVIYHEKLTEFLINFTRNVNIYFVVYGRILK